MSGGGGSNKAGDEANRMEAERQASIKAAQARINSVFNDPGRGADIADTVAASQQYLQRDLDEQKVNNDRDLKFALARGGVIGGSTQNDQQKVLGKAYGKGTLEVQRRALEIGSNLESADQDARARLISLATSGLDATTAAQQAAAAMRSNLEAGKAASTAQGIGDFFGATKTFADNVKDAQQRRKALYDSQQALYGGSVVPGGYGGVP